MRLAGNWRNLFLWPRSCRVCYMFELAAPLRLFFFFFLRGGKKKEHLFLRLPSAAAAPPRHPAEVSTAPKRPLTFAPPFQHSVLTPCRRPPTHPPSPLWRFFLSTKSSLAQQSLNLLPSVVIKGIFFSPAVTRLLFSSANKTVQLAKIELILAELLADS